MNEISLLLTELINRASELDSSEFDEQIKSFLLNDLHGLRGRLMQGAKSQSWQSATGIVLVTKDWPVDVSY